jgi:arsenate reductase (thioredoxin)
MNDHNVSIDVLVFDGCPHVDDALTLANAVAQRLGPGISVTRIDVETEAEAKAKRFPGSPTIRVNGRDVEGRIAKEGALCCRTYEGGAGVPPKWMVEAAALRALNPKGLLFLCVANSARSQIGEGVARLMAPSDVKVQSAGSHPTGVRPEAAAVLAELGIDTSTHTSKNVSEIDPETVDTVITLCAEEACPVFLGQAHRLHWGLPDPAAVEGDDETRLDAFRSVRDELRKRVGFMYPERDTADRC